MARVSIISMAAGTMPAATTSDTTSPAAAIDGKSDSRVCTDSGTRRRRTVPRVTIPRLLAGVRADRHGGAVRQHDLLGQHGVGGEAVLEAVRAAGVLRDVAADRAH